MDQKKIEEVYVDFGSGSCTAACNHCQFGLDKKKELTTAQQLEFYELVETYSKERGALMSVGLMDPIESYGGDLSFIRYAGSVRLSTRDIMTYFRGGEAWSGVAKVKSILGSATPLSLMVAVHSERSLARFLTGRDMRCIVALQLEIIKACDADVAFGFRTNRSNEDVEQAFQSMQRMGRRYRKAVKQLFPDIGITMSAKKSGSFAHLSVKASFDQKSHILEFGSRFINARYTKEEKEAADRIQEKNGWFVVALFPQEVHACHTTMNINDKTLRFSYPEMTEIVQEARMRKVNASSILFERIHERRMHPRRSFSLVTA